MLVSRENHLKSALVGMMLLFLVYNMKQSYTPYVLFFYLLYDFVSFYKLFVPDMIVHHILTMLLLTGYHHYPIEDTDTLIRMEVSTPFLVLYKMKVAKQLNKILFLLTFIYFRIYRVGCVAYTHRHDITDVYIWIAYGLWLLNWHWLITILGHFREQKIVINTLNTIVPYTHFLSMLALQKHPALIQWSCLLSSTSSFAYHTTKSSLAFILDRTCLHIWSWMMGVFHTDDNPFMLISLPIHLYDLVVWQHPLPLLVSIGWDVVLIFLSQQDLMWLALWVIISMLYVRQVLGYGTTQALVHLFIACAVSQLDDS